MEIQSFQQDVAFSDAKPVIKVILQTSFSKEIRILLKKGQVMKEHTAPYPIVVHILKGEIDFGINGDAHVMKEGSIVTLEGNVKHDLKAKEDSVVRLTLQKGDDTKRVEKVINS